jgi:hypothetical protein
MKITWLKKCNIIPLAIIIAGSTTAVPAFAQTQTAQPAQTNPGEIHDRKVNQQDRIAQGVKSGELTPHETANLEKKEAAINRETRNDRQANGGKLTPGEKAKVNQQQNKVSRQIYRDKHDNATTKP